MGGVVLVEFLRKVEFLEAGAEGIERWELEDFEHIYHLHSRRVHSLCLRMAGNIAAAGDLTQQALLQACNKLDTFRWMRRGHSTSYGGDSGPFSFCTTSKVTNTWKFPGF